jgi:hypothetical protein
MHVETKSPAAAQALDMIARLFDTTLAKISGKCDYAKAIRYATSRWTALTRYVETDIWKCRTTPPNAQSDPLLRAERITYLPAPTTAEVVVFPSDGVAGWEQAVGDARFS